MGCPGVKVTRLGEAPSLKVERVGAPPKITVSHLCSVAEVIGVPAIRLEQGGYFLLEEEGCILLE